MCLHIHCNLDKMLETQDLKDFSILTWYESFKSVTLKTIIINIPLELLEKLREDTNDLEIEEVCTPAFLDSIKEAIRVFNGQAFVKSNWHAPIDAKFLSLGYALTVTSIQELLLYFTASDIISNDFSHNKFDSFCIALKPWMNIHPASEFRCIVINGILQGITPRDWPTYYGHFSDDGPNIIRCLSEFYKGHIHEKFSRKTFTFDVILNFPDNVSLLDFGPLNSKTNLYAFSWKEIQAIIKKNSPEEVPPVFRYLESDMGIMTRTEALHKISQSQKS